MPPSIPKTSNSQKQMAQKLKCISVGKFRPEQEKNSPQQKDSIYSKTESNKDFRLNTIDR